jgi:hypothetical protein
MKDALQTLGELTNHKHENIGMINAQRDGIKSSLNELRRNINDYFDSLEKRKNEKLFIDVRNVKFNPMKFSVEILLKVSILLLDFPVLSTLQMHVYQIQTPLLFVYHFAMFSKFLSFSRGLLSVLQAFEYTHRELAITSHSFFSPKNQNSR